MEQYSIQQTSQLLKMSKDTLRYYDKLGLVCPTRGGNRYRYYTEQNMLDLQYIEAMKYAQFTLAEIRQFFRFRRAQNSKNDYMEIIQLFEDKKLEFQQKIKTYRTMIILIEQAMQLKTQHTASNGMDAINEMIRNVFDDIKGGKYEK